MNFQTIALRFAFLITLLGTLGSLYFSEVAGFPPCALCWYQRIFLYPLAFIFGVALWSEDQGYKKYALPLSLSGIAISGYHNLLYFGIIPEKLAPCTREVSCSAKQLELFGFITIPVMSLVCFIFITALVLVKGPQQERS